MQLRRLLALAALSFLAMSNSCKKDDDVGPCNALADVTTFQITGLAARITEPVPQVGQTHQYVINSAAEYRALFAGKKLPPVDFATYTLLAGKTRTAGPCRIASQQVAQTCAGYTYAVKLAPSAVPAGAARSYRRSSFNGAKQLEAVGASSRRTLVVVGLLVLALAVTLGVVAYHLAGSPQ